MQKGKTVEVPAAHVRHTKGRRIRVIITFAGDLQKRLPDEYGDSVAAEALLKEVQKQSNAIQALAQQPQRRTYGDAELENHGTALWNLCTRLRRDIPEQDDGGSSRGQRLLLCSRTFAFQLLDLAQWSDKAAAEDAIRLLKLALKAGRSCAGSDDLDPAIATMALQRAVEYISCLQNMRKDLSGDEAYDCDRLEVEYFIVRIAVSWKESRLDLAEHMYTKAEKVQRSISAQAAENLADVLYEIGKDLTSKRDFAMAHKWLDRANKILETQDVDQLSREGTELRMAIFQALVKAFIGLSTTESLKQAAELVEYIESEVGNKLLVLLLRLELINASPGEVFDCDAYADILRRIVQSVNVTEATFKLMVHHLRKLHSKAPGLACTVSDDLLRNLLKIGRDDWIERLVLTRIWMITTQRDAVEVIETAHKEISKVESPLGPDATIAGQTLIWKKVESTYGQGQFDLTERWCQLALDKVFRNAGPNTTGKFERKMLLCSISRNNLSSARSVFHAMADATQKEPLTQYLMYKVAVSDGDRDLATQCLENVSAAAENHDFLYACVLESRRVSDDLCAVDALKKLAANYEYKPNPVHLPALLRCTIRIQARLLKGDETRIERAVLVQDLCDTFDGAVAAIQKAPRGDDGKKLFDINELDWFCCNAYNLGIKHFKDWELRQTVHLLTSCTRIIAKFPSDLPAQVASEISLKSLFSNFVISSCLVALARVQDHVELQLQDYLVMRKHIADFANELDTRLRTLDESGQHDMLHRLSTLLVFDFEGAVALKNWEDLDGIVRRAERCEDTTVYQAMGDCLLTADIPYQERFSTMRRIVAGIWSLENMTYDKLAKYMRCLFKVTLPIRGDLALQLLEEACEMAKQAIGGEPFWPAEELEWLATTGFNHAVDLFAMRQDEQCKRWALIAISLAHYCGDGGRLESTLYEKYSHVMAMGMDK